jgi:integrase
MRITPGAFMAAYQAALAGEGAPEARRVAGPGTIAALVTSYMRSAAYIGLRQTTKTGYASRIEVLRTEHGHRIVKQMTREGIESRVLAPYSDRPGAALSILKMLRILIRHAMGLDQHNPLRLDRDPSIGIKRPKTKEIRAWTDTEITSYERRWPLGTKQRTAYALMQFAGTARVDAHRITWRQVDDGAIGYTRSKTGVAVDLGLYSELQAALAAAPRGHVTIINTEFGRPFTVDGFSQFMRDAISAAGLPLDYKPHGLRKTLGRRLADEGATAHEIMAALGHRTLEEAERYTREADRRQNGRKAIAKLEARNANRLPKPPLAGLGKIEKSKGGSK